MVSGPSRGVVLLCLLEVHFHDAKMKCDNRGSFCKQQPKLKSLSADKRIVTRVYSSME